MMKDDLVRELTAIREQMTGLVRRIDAAISSAQSLTADAAADESDIVAIQPSDPELPTPAAAPISAPASSGGSLSIGGAPAPAAVAPSSGGLSLKIGGGSPASAPASTGPSLSTSAGAPSGGDGLAKQIVELGQHLEAEKYAASPKTVDFLKAAEKNYHSMPETERGGEKAMKQIGRASCRERV